MIRIALCDAAENDLYALRDLLQTVLNEYGIEYKIDLFVGAAYLVNSF